MLKTKSILCVCICVLICSEANANWFADIVNRIEKTNVINTDILNSQNAELNVEQDILTSQKEVENLLRGVNESMIGHSGWGDYQSHDYQSYGNGSSNWNDVLIMAQVGRGDGDLGSVMGNLANQFPSDEDVFNHAVNEKRNQQYYALQTQTILAARATSQLDYNKIQDQILYQQMLQQQIEKTKDVKAALDLNNRIQVEGNLINLQILRQAAVGSQQQAIHDQASVNAALANARFLNK